jgi:hexosaminidase
VLHDTGVAEGAYRLTIAPDGVAISGGAAGVFHAGVTLLNLRATTGAFPCGTIHDAPRFGWRGQHLDCARHFFGVDTILRLLDLMALFKLNRFHWHFADDEAFRLQVQSAPALWQTTAFRGERCAVPGVFGGGIRSGGSYSRADVARIIAHAAALQIAVLPEIEVPAHAFAMNKAVPGLRDPGDNGAEVSVQGYRDNIINPALPGTWALLEPLLDEIVSLFPMGMLHLGCDELPHGAWEGSPSVRALMAAEGLQTPDDVQGWMMARLGAYLAEKGVRSAAWEEAAKGGNGGLGHGALLFSWTGQGPGIAAARAGYDVVMCPAQNVYFDMAHTDSPDDWGATWATILPLEQTVRWQPVPVGAEDVAHRIVGVQGCFWAEFTTADWQLEAMLCPRILGLANKGWDVHDSLDGAGLRAIARSYAPVFSAIGWQQAGGAG